MTREQKRQLETLEERVNELMSICDRQKAEIKTLTLTLEQGKANLEQVRGEFQALKSEYDDLLTVRVLSGGEGGDMKSARKKLLHLVREIDECINYVSLSNE